jgi:KDO2-lipid IV(A) lauroyltransferase
VIVVTAHFGSVDFLGHLNTLHGLRITAVVERLEPEKLFQYLASIRARYGITLVPTDTSMRPVFRALRAGELVGLALDRDVTDSGVEIEFFGEPARLPDGYARLARHTGSPIVLVFGVRLPDYRLQVRFEPALDIPQTPDREGDIRAIMRQALRVAGRYIAEHPEQWVMFRPVWRAGDRHPSQSELNPATRRSTRDSDDHRLRLEDRVEGDR